LCNGSLNQNIQKYEYKKLKMIAKGSVSIVWKCKNTYSDQIFAMKVVPKNQNLNLSRYLVVN
jgi:serine/threonine protein kinase